MEEGILASVKKILGEVPPDVIAFDEALIAFINNQFVALYQMGVGPSSGFAISGYSETWSQFLTDPMLLNSAKVYISLKVKLAFDPPQSSAHIESYERIIRETEWRIHMEKELRM